LIFVTQGHISRKSTKAACSERLLIVSLQAKQNAQGQDGRVARPLIQFAGDRENTLESEQEEPMSIFGKIVSAVFGRSSSPAGGTAAAAPAPAAPAAKGTQTLGGAPATGKAMTRDEVETMIKQVAGAQSGKYNWNESIVDLMKLLKLDSSLAARKELAKELGYKGALNGSAAMNIWLHKQVMTKLAESGGVVPANLQQAKPVKAKQAKPTKKG
jgi:hypothetical protein